MPPLETPFVSVYDLLAHIESSLFQIWQETGFGYIELDSSKVGQDLTQVILRNSTHHYYSLRNQDIYQVLCRESTGYSYAINHEFLTRFETLLLRILSETGFGQIAISSTRIKQNKIRIILQGSPHYRYVISDEDIGGWKGN